VTLPDSTQARFAALFAAIDAKDTDRFLGYLTDDGSFRFGAAPPAEGKEAVRAAVDGFFSSIAGCQHVVPRYVVLDDVIMCEGQVTYTRHDDSQVTLPFANVFEMDGELISSYKIYTDISPLYA
jgi:ketosteroid isomerase-like protein